MQKVNDWDNVKAAADKQVLPKGGYICKIIDAKETTYQGTNGEFKKLEIAFDIAEGDFKDFYKADFSNNPSEDKKWKGVLRLYSPKDDGSEKDEWTKRKLKAVTNAIEDSNSGYHWDWNEKGLKGKVVGAIFRSEEWEMNGRSGWATRCNRFVPVEVIRSGEYKVPEDLPLKKETNQGVPGVNPADFENVDIDDNDLPF